VIEESANEQNSKADCNNRKYHDYKS
jgi:hypothetical protein